MNTTSQQQQQLPRPATPAPAPVALPSNRPLQPKHHPRPDSVIGLTNLLYAITSGIIK